MTRIETLALSTEDFFKQCDIIDALPKEEAPAPLNTLLKRVYAFEAEVSNAEQRQSIEEGWRRVDGCADLAPPLKGTAP